MQTYILFEKVRGAWVKLGEYDDPTTLASMAYHLGALHGNKPVEIRVETVGNAGGASPAPTGSGRQNAERSKPMRFILNGCDISFIAEAPSDITLAQLLKQADRIVPEWCACGIRSLESSEENIPTEIVFDYDDVRKTTDDVCCSISRKEGTAE